MRALEGRFGCCEIGRRVAGHNLLMKNRQPQQVGHGQTAGPESMRASDLEVACFISGSISVRPPVCPSIRPPVRPSARPSVRLSVCPSIGRKHEYSRE